MLLSSTPTPNSCFIASCFNSINEGEFAKVNSRAKTGLWTQDNQNKLRSLTSNLGNNKIYYCKEHEALASRIASIKSKKLVEKISGADDSEIMAINGQIITIHETYIKKFTEAIAAINNLSSTPSQQQQPPTSQQNYVQSQYTPSQPIPNVASSSYTPTPQQTIHSTNTHNTYAEQIYYVAAGVNNYSAPQAFNIWNENLALQIIDSNIHLSPTVINYITQIKDQRQNIYFYSSSLQNQHISYNALALNILNKVQDYQDISDTNSSHWLNIYLTIIGYVNKQPSLLKKLQGLAILKNMNGFIMQKFNISRSDLSSHFNIFTVLEISLRQQVLPTINFNLDENNNFLPEAREYINFLFTDNLTVEVAQQLMSHSHTLGSKGEGERANYYELLIATRKQEGGGYNINNLFEALLYLLNQYLSTPNSRINLVDFTITYLYSKLLNPSQIASLILPNIQNAIPNINAYVEAQMSQRQDNNYKNIHLASQFTSSLDNFDIQLISALNLNLIDNLKTINTNIKTYVRATQNKLITYTDNRNVSSYNTYRIEANNIINEPNNITKYLNLLKDNEDSINILITLYTNILYQILNNHELKLKFEAYNTLAQLGTKLTQVTTGDIRKKFIKNNLALQTNISFQALLDKISQNLPSSSTTSQQ